MSRSSCCVGSARTTAPLLLLFVFLTLALTASFTVAGANDSSDATASTNASTNASANASTNAPAKANTGDWLADANHGDYDQAVAQALGSAEENPLATLIQSARAARLASTPMWHALLHYKPSVGNKALSQVDAEYFFMSAQGKRNPDAELEATLAAFYSTTVKPPLRLTAYCRFIARRQWLQQQLDQLADLLPEQTCAEFERFRTFLQANTLTLIFPSAHPNSPSSAFGHTLIRIDNKDQSHDSRLLNMSINFAAEVPADIAGATYALKGLAGGFPGKYRLLPYHIKLREYGQIENRDTWEYSLKLSQQQVDAVLRHAYEMLISHFDYYFLSENCSYHLLSLLDVALADNRLTDNFNLWTIPIDTIKLLRARGLVDEGRFVPSSIRTLRARRAELTIEDQALTLQAFNNGLPATELQLQARTLARQAGILDLLADYKRYQRLQNDARAQSSSVGEREVLSRRSKLPIKSKQPNPLAPGVSPEMGHATSRLSVRYQTSQLNNDNLELTFRPAYHDFRDPSSAYGSNAAINFGEIGIARDLDANKVFVSRFNLISIESLEPRGSFFKPVSWHTRVNWHRPDAESHHRFTFNVGAGVAFQSAANRPLTFGFLESDVIDDPAFDKRLAIQLGVSGGAHWEPVAGFRTGIEFNFRQRTDQAYNESTTELWASVALGNHWSLVVDASLRKRTSIELQSAASVALRLYF